MKKLFLLLAAMFCTAGVATAQEELSLARGWNCNIGTTEIGEIPQYPAQVTIGGQWQNIKICAESFDATEWVSYKIVLAEPVEDGQIQVMIRNAAEAQSYGGNYQEIPGGVTEYTNGFADITFTDGDPVVTLLGIQNRTSSQVTFVLNDVVLYKADGTEWHTTLANDWGGTVKKLSEGEVIENYTFGQWGTLYHDFGQNVTPADGDIHRFIVTSSEPFPAGFQWKIIRGSNDGDASYPGAFTEGETEATVELTEENIRKSADDPINYYTGVAIQCTGSGTLPMDVKMFREIRYGNGAILREQLPVMAGGYGNDAEIIDPDPAAEVGENGLPAKVILNSQWQDVKLWKDDFDVTEYPGFKIVLREAIDPEDIQMFYRTETHGSSGGVYVPWKTDPNLMVEVSEDGKVMTGEFDIDALEGDNVVLRFALQNRLGNTVNMTIEGVYLINEDEEEVPTEGLTADGWNAGTILPVGGSYDDDGNIWDAYVQFNSANSSLGDYGEGNFWGAPTNVAEGTYHVVHFYSDEPFPAGVAPWCYNMMFDQDFNMNVEWIESTVEGQGTDHMTIKIPRSYNYLSVHLMLPEGEEYPATVRFTKVVREVFENETPTAIDDRQAADAAAARVVTREFYNAAGAKLAQPAKGVTIVRETLSNGQVRSKKVMMK